MTIEVMSYEDFRLREKADPLARTNRDKYYYDFWLKGRNGLLSKLSQCAIYNKDDYLMGDFFIGDDWFENGNIQVVVMNWPTLNGIFISNCQEYLQQQNREFVITVGKDHSSERDYGFVIIITCDESYMAFYKKSRSEVQAIVDADDRFKGIRSLLI